MIHNKKGFTLIEIIVVIWIILFILYSLSNIPVTNVVKVIEKQNVKDWVVNVTNEVRNYSYNNVTVWQDVIKESDLKTNTQVSRFDTARDWTNSTSKLAYYHWIYFTTSENDAIHSWVNNDPSNWNFYLVQYRQEGYTNVRNRILEAFDIKYSTSIQLLKWNGWTTIWTKKFHIPTFRTYYLNKIIWAWGNCDTTPSVATSWYILYSTNNLNYVVYINNVLDKTFNYKLCFSQDQTTYEPKTGFDLELNRNRLGEYYFETLENY